MLEKFLAAQERIADALEVIAASKTAGATAPRTEEPVIGDLPAAKAAEDKKKADAKAKRDAKAAADKAKASADPTDLDDPLGGTAEETKRDYTEKDVREILAKVIDKEGRAAAFDILAKQGGAKSFTDLKKEKYEDVYVEAEQRLA